MNYPGGPMYTLGPKYDVLFLVLLREGSQFKWPGGGLKNIFGGRKKFDPPLGSIKKSLTPPQGSIEKSLTPPKSTRQVYL